MVAFARGALAPSAAHASRGHQQHVGALGLRAAPTSLRAAASSSLLSSFRTSPPQQPAAHRRLCTLRVAAKPGRSARLFCRAGHSAIPPAQGLFDPANDKDACGVGFVGELSRQPSRKVVTDALKMLARMTHRGACGCEENTGEEGGERLEGLVAGRSLSAPLGFERPGGGGSNRERAFFRSSVSVVFSP
jgi:hypothetical protein